MVHGGNLVSKQQVYNQQLGNTSESLFRYASLHSITHTPSIVVNFISFAVWVHLLQIERLSVGSVDTRGDPSHFLWYVGGTSYYKYWLINVYLSSIMIWIIDDDDWCFTATWYTKTGRAAYKCNEAKSEMKHPSDMPTPKFELRW